MGFIDFVLILILVYLSYKLWIISYKKKKKKLLLRVTSIFILVHLIIFPLIYTSLINHNPESIEIHNKIINTEKNIRLKEFKKDNNTDFQNQKYIINKILIENKKLLDSISIDDIVEKKLLILNSNIIYCSYIEFPPSAEDNKTLIIYDETGYQLFDFFVSYKKKEITTVLEDYLKELESDQIKKDRQLETINSNSFWTYRRILPYTLNILFTGNFNPISSKAQVVYYIHNIFVLGFLLSFISTLFQNILIKNNKE